MRSHIGFVVMEPHLSVCRIFLLAATFWVASFHGRIFLTAASFQSASFCLPHLSASRNFPGRIFPKPHLSGHLSMHPVLPDRNSIEASEVSSPSPLILSTTTKDSIYVQNLSTSCRFGRDSLNLCQSSHSFQNLQFYLLLAL